MVAAILKNNGNPKNSNGEGERLQRICVDMDEVMADTLGEHIRRYNQTFDEEVTPEDLAGKGLWEVAPQDRQQQLRDFLDAEDFFEDLALIPGAQQVLQSLSARFEIFIRPHITSSAATRAFGAPTISSTTCPKTFFASRARACSTPRRATSPLPASSASTTGSRSPITSPASLPDGRNPPRTEANLRVRF
jgi:hypothetical protein